MPSAPYLIRRLHDEWLKEISAFRVGREAGEALFEDLVAAYSEPGRHYHTLKHVSHVLAVIDWLRPHPKHGQLLRLAGWLHDIVYNAKADDNEERSADYAARLLAKTGLTPALRELIGGWILLTRHRTEPSDAPEKTIVDADLAILGAPPGIYRRYARQIRREYAWLPEAEYRTGRIRVLRRFLDRPRLYYTKRMFAAREEKARRNMAREIEALRRPGLEGAEYLEE